MEHLGAGDDGFLDIVLETDDLDLVADLDGTTLDTARNDGAAAGDGEHVLDGHQEGQVSLTVGGLDPGVNSFHELPDAVILGGVGIGGLGGQSVQSGTLDDRCVVAGEVVLVEQLTDFHLNELEELGVVNLVALVQENKNVGNVNLTGEQQVLTGLSHRAVGSGDDEDAAVHLSGAGDHVLDIVGVARAVDVGVVTALDLHTLGGAVRADAVKRLVLNVGSVDGDAALALFGRLVDGGVVNERSGVGVGHREGLGDGGGQGGLTMVDVADGTDIHMGLAAVEHLLSHGNILLIAKI